MKYDNLYNKLEVYPEDNHLLIKKSSLLTLQIPRF